MIYNATEYQKNREKRKDLVWTIVLSIIVLSPNIYLAIYGNEGLSTSLILLGVSCLLYFLPAFFLKKRIFFILQGFFVLLAPLEIAHIYLNKMPATSAFLLSIIGTNQGESLEMLLSLKIPLAILFLVWVFYFYITFAKINSAYFSKSAWIRLTAILLFIGTVTTSYATRYSKIIYPYDIMYRVNQAFSTMKDIKSGRGKVGHFKFNATRKETVSEREIYVFVIGETGRYTNFSINGYGRNTSPMLSGIDNLTTYSDFYSEANITTTSLQLMLTRATVRNFAQSYVEKSFVDAFQEAGFKTYWIADQSDNNAFIRRISGDANGEYFSPKSASETGFYDEQLFPYLEDILAKNDKKALIVIHSLGSHFKYSFRYPDKFEVFKPTLKGAFDYNLISAKNRELFVNTYDNSILYTDYFLSETIRKVDSLHAVSAFVYVADHGENLFDTKQNIVFHGGSDFTEYDFHVPFFVWTSGKYIDQYPAKAANIRENRNKKLSSDNIFYSILDIADIDFPEQILTKSIASKTLREDSVRYVLNTNMEIKKGF